MLSTQYSTYTTVQSSYEWAMNRRWVLWLSLAERCYYNIISPLIGQNLPSDASDWLTRLLTRNSVTLGECELCIVSSTANRDNGAQRSERRGRAASPASGSSHNSAVSVSIKTSMQRYFAQVFYVFFVINQLNIVKVDPCMLCEWWYGWGPLDNGQRQGREHPVKLSMTRVMSLSILNSDSHDHTQGWTMRLLVPTAMDIYLMKMTRLKAAL